MGIIPVFKYLWPGSVVIRAGKKYTVHPRIVIAGPRIISPPPQVVNKILLSPTGVKVFIEYLPHFDNQPTIIIRQSENVIFSKNRKRLMITPATIR